METQRGCTVCGHPIEVERGSRAWEASRYACHDCTTSHRQRTGEDLPAEGAAAVDRIRAVRGLDPLPEWWCDLRTDDADGEEGGAP